MAELEAWQTFNRQLRAYVARRVAAPVVDDILGDILLRVAEHRDQFNSAANPHAWLYRVASNIITDHYRRHAVERKALQQAGIDAAEVGSPAESDGYTELAQCLIPLIRQLPEEYRDALLLTDIDGVTQTAAAAQLGLSLSGMKSRVQRGRGKLKKALQRCCEIEVNKQGRIVDYERRSSCQPCGKSCKSPQ